MRRGARAFWAWIILVGGSWGCGTPNPKAVYHLEVGARAEYYTEVESTPLDQALAASTGHAVTMIQGDPTAIRASGIGGQVALTQQNNHLVSEVGLFVTSYSPVYYAFNVAGLGTVTETLNVLTFGTEGSFGYELWWFRPHISYLFEDIFGHVTATAAGIPNSTSTVALALFMGGGLTLDVPIAPPFHIVASADYRWPIFGAGTIAGSDIVAWAGLRLFGGDPHKKGIASAIPPGTTNSQDWSAPAK